MLNLPLYNNTKLLLAFEYGTILSETAKKMNIELTPEIMERAEKIIVSEFKSNTPTKLSTDMVPIILAIFETN